MSCGTLYIVSTPIGNLGDITLRALEILKSVDLIACEDTRRTKKLTSHYGIKTALTSYFEHNKITKSRFLINQLKEGKDVALVSDAGTPGISDPGFYIIREAVRSGIKITHAPGACALIAGLVLSAKPTDSFVFEGFLSHKSAARKKRLAALLREKRTVILYESCHRLLKTLGDIASLDGEREVVCVKEATKVFEEAKRGKAADLMEHFSKDKVRGEYTIVF